MSKRQQIIFLGSGGGSSSPSNTIRETITVSNSFSAGNVVYNANGVWTLAKADALSTTYAVGVIESATGSSFVIVYAGTITLSALAASSLYYLSDATAGLLTSTAPSTTTSFLVPILRTGTTTAAYVEIGAPSSLAKTDLTADVTGTLPVANGGTGVTTASNGQLLIGNGSGFTKATLIAGSNITVTNGAGTIQIDASGGGGGGSGTANSALATSTTSVTVANSTGEATLIGTIPAGQSLTLPANFFTAGSSVEFTISGFFSSAVVDTLNLKLKAGSTVIGQTGAVAYGSITSQVWSIRAVLTCYSTGVSGTFQLNTKLESTGSALTPQDAPIKNTSTVTLDTTGSLVIDFTATWSAASASDTITCSNFMMVSPGWSANTVLNLRQTFSNANASVTAGNTTINQIGTLSAPRTLTLAAASAYSAGQRVRITDTSGTATFANTITIARAGSDTINGGSVSFIIGTANGSVLLESDGTSAWTIVDATVDQQTWTTSGTWTKSAGAKEVHVICIGAGGGGGGGQGNASGVILGAGGGGGGAREERTVRAGTVGTTVTVTVGAAGTAGTGGASTFGIAGVSGGTSSFGSICFGGGGGGGGRGNAAATASVGGGGGGTFGQGNAGGTGGVTVAGGSPGGSATASQIGGAGGQGTTGGTTGGSGGAAERGGGGGGGSGTTAAAVGAGGSSIYGAGGGGSGGGSNSGTRVSGAAGGVSGAYTSGGGGAGGAGSDGASGAPGADAATNSTLCGYGGGGGAGVAASATGGTGGAGGFPAGGGGGGGGGISTGGPGGAGALGVVVVITRF